MSEAHGINNSGQIVGHSRISSGYEHAFLYSGGTMQDLGTLPGCVSSNAYDINSTGQVVGDSQDSSGHFHAFLYSNGMMQDLGSLSGYTNSPAYAINDNGVVVGGVWKDHDITGASSLAVLFVDGKLIDLNSLTVPSSGWDLLSANAINSKGQIVGVGINPSGQKDAFLLTPTSTPEPSTLALLGTGALSLLACEWRRRRGA
jgi:probable HAF family extracellular repeat protein